MLYLKASSSVETLDEYNGEKGMFIKTFAFNTERNKNGWRVTWPSVKKGIADFIGKPGIEYIKCTEAGCDLDHTEAVTYEASLEVQEPFRKTTIIDYTLNENEETSFFIHKTDDREFFDKIVSGEIQYVSPSVWPVFYNFLGGRMPNDEPILDVFEWFALHDAFVNDPAFGDDAKIVSTCEGENCQMQMLTAKQIMASRALRAAPSISPGTSRTVIFRLSDFHEKEDECDDYADTEYNLDFDELPDIPVHPNCDCYFEDKATGDNLGNMGDEASMSRTKSAKLNRTPIMIQHKGSMHLVSVSAKIARQINNLYAKEKHLGLDSVSEILKNNSLNACSCSSKVLMAPDKTDKENLEAATAALKAAKEDADKKDEKVKELESKLAKMAKDMEEKAKSAGIAACDKCGSTDHTTDKHTDENSKDSKDAKAVKAVTARLVIAEKKLAEPMIEKMLKARTDAGVPDDEIKTLKEALSGKSYADIEAQFNSEKVFLDGLVAKEEGKHFDFNDSVAAPLVAKTSSLEEIFQEVS